MHFRMGFRLLFELSFQPWLHLKLSVDLIGLAGFGKINDVAKAGLMLKEF